MVEDKSPLFTEYGQFVLLLDADPMVLREAIRDCDGDKIHRMIACLEDQINETPLEGNEELLKRHMFVWLMCVRELDEGHADESSSDTFKLNFEQWELEQFH